MKDYRAAIQRDIEALQARKRRALDGGAEPRIVRKVKRNALQR